MEIAPGAHRKYGVPYSSALVRPSAFIGACLYAESCSQHGAAAFCIIYNVVIVSVNTGAPFGVVAVDGARRKCDEDCVWVDKDATPLCRHTRI